MPRHGTSPLGYRALWHGMALSEDFSAVPGPESGHGGTTRHGTTVTSCLIVPYRVVPVPPVWKTIIGRDGDYACLSVPSSLPGELVITDG